jgi:acetoacetyl-CoA synthetase
VTELWRPSRARIDGSELVRFARSVGVDEGADLMARLHARSIAEPSRFWEAVWAFTGVLASERADATLRHGDRMPGARWFEGARLNFAENLLKPIGDDEVGTSASFPALASWNEFGHVRSFDRTELRHEVARVAAGFHALGVGEGDVVGGFLPNVVEAAVAMLATSTLGAIWTCCSTDFGVEGALDRLRQARPKVLIAGLGSVWKGRWHDGTNRVAAIASDLADHGLERVIVARYGREHVPGAMDRLGAEVPDRLAPLPLDALPGSDDTPPRFAQLPFDHPLYILYSSGTTGVPKCIVHGQGGTLLQHLKELALHTDLRAGDRVLYYTTTGWMMWNWLVSGLARGAEVVLYDGSPLAPEPTAMWDLIDAAALTHFGTSAKYLATAEKAGLKPRATHDLSTLRTVLSTGSPLLPASFDWVYGSVKPDVHLASISGGTDIVSCFLLGDPTGPVHRGELQCTGLGMRVEAWREDGARCGAGEPGELVCAAPFPAMPVGFLNDPDGARYRAAYFEQFDIEPAVWRHGDWVERTPSGGFVVHGRSDTTLNPGGVRIGTAEIYRQVDTLDEVVDSVAIGQRWDGDVRVVLFVVLRPGHELDDPLRDRIRGRIREGTTPRHVPAVVIQVPDVPRTASGKVSEVAVTRVVHGEPVTNRATLANPEVLQHFGERIELRQPATD